MHLRFWNLIYLLPLSSDVMILSFHLYTSRPGIFLKKILPKAFRVRAESSSQAGQSTSAIEISYTSHSYRDNESIFAIFTALKCAHSALQFRLDKWKWYVVVDWCASCEMTVRTLVSKLSFDDWAKRVWWSTALRTWIKYWLNLSTLRNTDAELIMILSDRSFALSDFNEYFFIESVLWDFWSRFRATSLRFWIFFVVLFLRNLDFDFLFRCTRFWSRYFDVSFDENFDFRYMWNWNQIFRNNQIFSEFEKFFVCCLN